LTSRERIIYAFEADGAFRVTREPPDAPVRPSVEFATSAEVEAHARSRRAKLIWWPRLKAARGMKRAG
jgi:hypothetical protein